VINQSNSPYSRPMVRKRSSSMPRTGLKLTESSLTSTQPSIETAFLSISSKTSLMHSRNNSVFEEGLEKQYINDIQKSILPQEKLKTAQKYFEHIIQTDIKHGQLLKYIKNLYEDNINNTAIQCIQKLKNEIKELQLQTSKESWEKQLFNKKYEKIVKENEGLAQTLDEVEGKYKNLLAKLKEISCIDIKQIPKDEITWKALVYENESLSRVNREISNELQKIMEKEKGLLENINYLKQEGASDLKKSIINKPKEDKVSDTVYNTDDEALVSGRPKHVARPKSIPMLNFGLIRQQQYRDDQIRNIFNFN
jgi:hypothetical protein